MFGLHVTVRSKVLDKAIVGYPACLRLAVHPFLDFNLNVAFAILVVVNFAVQAYWRLMV
jgi:hypothetical protein